MKTQEICLEYNALSAKYVIYITAVLKLVLVYCHSMGLYAFIDPACLPLNVLSYFIIIYFQRQILLTHLTRIIVAPCNI